MNKVILSGFLGSDPELKTFKEIEVVKFSLPYNESYGDKKVTHWFNCTAFKQTAVFVNKHFKKGDPIEVEGKLLTDTWKNKEGQQVTTTYIRVDNVYFVPAKKKEDF